MNFVCLAVVIISPLSAYASAINVNLGTAGTFAVLAGQTATNTGATIINGNVGVDPGSSITGVPPAVVVPPSTQYAADAVALQAQNDLTTGYNFAAGETCPALNNLTGTDLAGCGKTLSSPKMALSKSCKLLILQSTKHTPRADFDERGVFPQPARWTYPPPGSLLLHVGGGVDGNTHSQRRRRLEFGVRFPDRGYVDHPKRLVCSFYQWHSRRRLLAGRQFGDSRQHHFVRGKYSRARQHLPGYRRNYFVRQCLSGNWRCDDGDEPDFCRLRNRGQRQPLPQRSRLPPCCC